MPSHAIAFSVFGPFVANYSFYGVFFPRSSLESGCWLSLFAFDRSLAMSSLPLSLLRGILVIPLQETMFFIPSCLS